MRYSKYWNDPADNARVTRHKTRTNKIKHKTPHPVRLSREEHAKSTG
jgi:hypothetical protein